MSDDTQIAKIGNNLPQPGRPQQPTVVKRAAATKIAVKNFFIRFSSDPGIDAA